MSSYVCHVNDKIPEAVYIGRAAPRAGLKASPLKNKFTVGAYGNKETAVAHYALWLMEQIVEGNATVINELILTRGKPLACWCRSANDPYRLMKPCHGTVIAYIHQTIPDELLRDMIKE